MSSPLAWPKDRAVCRPIPDPARHFDAYGDRFPAFIAAVLGQLADAAGSGAALLIAGWPDAPEAYRFEYARLVAWFKADPAAVPEQLAAGGDSWDCFSISPRRNPLAGIAAPGTAPKADAPGRPWPPSSARVRHDQGEPVHLGAIVARLAHTLKATGCASIAREAERLQAWHAARPGLVTPAWLAEQEAAWASEGAATVAHAVAAAGRARCLPGRGTTLTLPSLHHHDAPHDSAMAGVSPVEHLAAQGGHAGLTSWCDPGEAHQLWDAARLWERDQGTGRAARWALDYWRAWARATAGKFVP